MSPPERLARLVEVEPPPELDRCVRQRLLASVEVEAARARAPDGPDEGRFAVDVGSPAIPLPLAERCVYVVGLLGFGARALGAAAQLVWRAVAG
jgi:hypothetical protein